MRRVVRIPWRRFRDFFVFPPRFVNCFVKSNVNNVKSLLINDSIESFWPFVITITNKLPKKFINFNTGYTINGTIKGNIFPDDTISIKGIRFPLYTIKDSTIDATIFQSKGMDIFPMAYLHFKKQN